MRSAEATSHNARAPCAFDVQEAATLKKRQIPKSCTDLRFAPARVMARPLFYIHHASSEANMIHFPFAISVAGLMIISGCTHSGGVVARYDPGQPPSISRAPRAGDYYLSTLQGSQYIRLQARQPIGFARSPRGELLAIAADHQVPLPERHHCWVVAATGQPQPETAISEFRANLAADWKHFRERWRWLPPVDWVGTPVMLVVAGDLR